ncbi:MAG: cation transporter [Sandaracinus sp.]|nr:cation transporter [Sandaracinus sp.]MCB9619743.1 cation transporter [Sandaracinus sp.]MCB9623329.1 cation transporter [Sandaracinus sp.]
MAHGSKKVVLLALGANLGIAIAKFVAFFLTASASLMAEAIHSLADTGNQVLLLWGMKKAAKPPDERHPFGYKMESYFWSFIVAVMLFSLGGLFALYEGLHKIDELDAIREAGGTYEMAYPEVAIGVLVVAILLEGFSWWAATREVNRLRGKQSMLKFIESSKSTEIIVIWMEDTGALVGLVLALAGVILTLTTGNPYWDAYATFSIGALLIVIAVVVARETKSLLIGESASPETQAELRRQIEQTEGVVRLMNLRTLQLGEDQLLAAIKVEWAAELTRDEIIERTNELEQRIRKEVPLARYLFVESDKYDEEKAKLPPYPA